MGQLLRYSEEHIPPGVLPAEGVGEYKKSVAYTLGVVDGPDLVSRRTNTSGATVNGIMICIMAFLRLSLDHREAIHYAAGENFQFRANMREVVLVTRTVV